MTSPVIVTFSASDLDADIAESSAAEVSEALSHRLRQPIITAALSDLRPDTVNQAALIFPCDSFPTPLWCSGHESGGTLKGYLEERRISFVGSGSKPVSLAKNKIAAKKVLSDAGVRVPLLYGIAGQLSASGIVFPAVYKPRVGSGSVGVRYLSTPTELRTVTENMEAEDAFIEEYIPGFEVTVAVAEIDEETKAMTPLEILLDGQVFTAARKNRRPYPEFRIFSSSAARSVQEAALASFRALGCQHYGRVDLRVSELGEPYVLEVNTAPRLSFNEYFAMSSRRSGFEYEDIIFSLYRAGISRFNNQKK
jgi:D-alanine-D-alanine ligase